MPLVHLANQQFICTFDSNSFEMTQVIIGKKKYVLIPQREYEALQKRAASKTKPGKLLSVNEARAYSKKLIRKWATEK